MRVLIFLLLLSGCYSNKSPTASDTYLNEEDRDWAEIYRMEIKRAVDNDDEDAYHFFFKEYMRERIEQIKSK
jgi:hypothetical protein|tara:strand:- start:310 stop:525 length:216 start_codon:yes stop_codon:yes gene_type:complete